jgi:hypothetical protein
MHIFPVSRGIKNVCIILPDLLFPSSHAYIRLGLCVCTWNDIESRFCNPHVVICLTKHRHHIKYGFRRITDKINKSKTIAYVHTQYIDAREIYYNRNN